jgi:pantoate--beta-alanine ligase
VTIALISTRKDLQAALGNRRPGLVPTMGALHAGHTSLISRSANENSLTVVSVFVNPTQFNDAHDLQRYPRDLTADVAMAESAGAAVVFAPAVEEIYPLGFDTSIEVEALSALWEGAHRPGHFRGVATVVAILLNLVRPARSYFGEKDFQQLQIIRRMHADLALPGEIIAGPTARDDDGLALSSRNARLSAADRERARAIPRALERMVEVAQQGTVNIQVLELIGRAYLEEAGLKVDYVAVLDEDTLRPLNLLQPGARVLVAAEVGGVRLIDNAKLPVRTNHEEQPIAASAR